MPNPTQQQIHINVPLTEISIATYQDESSFIADRVCPVIPVKKKSNLYFLYDSGDIHRIEARERAPGTESAGGGYGLSTAQYNCKRYSLHKDVDDEERENSDEPLDPDRDATMYVTQNLMKKRDATWANAMFKTTVWTTDLTGVAGAPGGGQVQQFDQAASTPIQVVRAQKSAVQALIGRYPNKIVMGRPVLDVLADHASIIDRLKYTMKATGKLVEEVMAEILGVEEILIGDAIQNTANEGAAKAMTRILGKHMLLVYVNPTPSRMQPSGCYTFSWSKFDRVKKGGAAIKKMRIEEREVDRIEGDMYFDQKLVMPDAGVFFSGVVS